IGDISFILMMDYPPHLKGQQKEKIIDFFSCNQEINDISQVSEIFDYEKPEEIIPPDPKEQEINVVENTPESQEKPNSETIIYYFENNSTDIDLNYEQAELNKEFNDNIDRLVRDLEIDGFKLLNCSM